MTYARDVRVRFFVPTASRLRLVPHDWTSCLVSKDMKLESMSERSIRSPNPVNELRLVEEVISMKLST